MPGSGSRRCWAERRERHTHSKASLENNHGPIFLAVVVYLFHYFRAGLLMLKAHNKSGMLSAAARPIMRHTRKRVLIARPGPLRLLARVRISLRRPAACMNQNHDTNRRAESEPEPRRVDIYVLAQGGKGGSKIQLEAQAIRKPFLVSSPPRFARLHRRRRRRWPGRGRRTPRRGWTRPIARSTPPSAAPPTPSPSSTRRPWPSRSSPSRPASATP